MSTISALTSRNLPASLYAGSVPNDSKTSASRQVQASNTVPASANPVSSITAGSASNALDQHLAAVSNDTIDYAQSFLSSFAQTLFGSSGKDAQISFDSASLDSSSTVAAGVRQTSGSFGSSSAAAFQLTDSSHFIGTGTITTADGRKFDFEVEVQYDAQLSAAASRSSSAVNSSSDTGSSAQQLLDSLSTQKTSSARTEASRGLTTSASELPKVQLPNIDFPGTLSDLFKLIGLDLQSALSTGDSSPDRSSDGIDRNTLRSLSLRLLNLVNSKDTNTYSAPSAADKAKAVSTDSDTAKAQGSTVATSSDATSSTAAEAAEAATDAAVAAPAPAAASTAADTDQDGDRDA